MTSRAGSYAEAIGAKYEKTPEPTATYSEGFDVGVGSFLSEGSVASRSLEYEDSSLARLLNIETPLRERNQMIEDLRTSGKISDETWYAHTKVDPYAADETDWEGLSIQLKREGIEIKDNSDVLKEVSSELLQRREYANEERKNFGVMATIGEFAGVMTGSMIDFALTLPAYAVGPSAAIGSTVRTGTGVAKAVAKVAGFEAGIQTGIEFGLPGSDYEGVTKFKEDIQSPYSTGQAVANVAMVGGGAAVMGGAAIGIGRLIQKVMRDPNLTPKQRRQAVQLLEQQRRQAEAAPDQNAHVDDYFAKLEAEMEFQNGPRGRATPEPIIDPALDATNVRIKPRIKLKLDPEGQAKAKAKKGEAKTKPAEEQDTIPEGLDENDVVLSLDEEGNVKVESAVESIKADDAKEDALKNLLECLING